MPEVIYTIPRGDEVKKEFKYLHIYRPRPPQITSFLKKNIDENKCGTSRSTCMPV